MSARKAWLGLLVAACIAMAFALPVFATVGDAGYLSWSSLGGTNGTSPHGGYSSTTQKCVVCHAVHEASSSGQALLQGTVADACTYCHVSLTSSYSQVYGSVPTNYANGTNDLNTAHNSITIGATEIGVKCTSCHQVHAAANQMTLNAYLTQKLLKGSSTNVAAYDPDLDLIPQAADATGWAMTKWCTTCHAVGLGATGSPDYYSRAFNGQSHIMTSAANIATYGNTFTSMATTQVAFAASEYCASCHASQYGSGAWPHYTTGVRFLVSGATATDTLVPATDSEQDGICLHCHKTGTGGVNMNW